MELLNFILFRINLGSRNVRVIVISIFPFGLPGALITLEVILEFETLTKSSFLAEQPINKSDNKRKDTIEILIKILNFTCF